MHSLLERIKAGTLWDFHGGIHPADNKLQSSQSPVVDAGLPPRLIIPLRQHAGPAGDLLVQVGDKVKKGQPLTRYAKGRVVPVHASTSGTITEIGNHTVAHPSGLGDLCVILTPDGEDEWGERNGKADYWNLERGELLERIQQAGGGGPWRRRVPDPQQARWPRPAHRDPDRQRAGVRTLYHHRRSVDAAVRRRDHGWHPGAQAPAQAQADPDRGGRQQARSDRAADPPRHRRRCAGQDGADQVPLGRCQADHRTAHRSSGAQRRPRGRYRHHGAQRRHRVCHQARHYRRRAADRADRHPHWGQLQKARQRLGAPGYAGALAVAAFRTATGSGAAGDHGGGP